MNGPTILLVLIGLLPSNISLAGEQPTLTRSQFAAAVNKITKGMPQEQVVSLLGGPDDIRTHNDPGGITTTRTKEIWRYGTSGHLTTATLGQIYIDDNEQVQYVFGKGQPPRDELFREEQLRQLLSALDAVPSYNAWNYNPRNVIRAVNLLQPLGKHRALAAIQEYLRVASHFHDGGREGMFLVLRVLFDVPDDPGYMPPMYVGASSPPAPEDKTLLPRFPIIVEDDIPFLVVHGYSLGGFPEQPESHIAFFRNGFTIRSKPLHPTATPLASLDTLASSPRLLFTDTDWLNVDEPGMLMLVLGNQILRLIDSVYRVEVGLFGELLPFGEKNAELRHSIIRDASSLEIHWDAKLAKYTFLDGSSLDQIKRMQYRRAIWKPEQPNLDAQITVERYNRRYVRVCLTQNYELGAQQVLAHFRVFDISAKDNSLVEWVAGRRLNDVPQDAQAPKSGTRISSKTIKLVEGTEIQIELSVADKTQLSPIIKP